MNSGEIPFEEHNHRGKAVPASPEAQREFEEAQQAAWDALPQEERAMLTNPGILITREYFS